MDWLARLKRDGSLIAVLLSDGTWRAKDKVTAYYLNVLYPLKSGPLVLPPGRFAASAAAKRLKAEAEFAEELEPLPPGVIS